MPQLRKLAPEEVQAIEDKGKGTRKLTEEQYEQLSAVAPTVAQPEEFGDYEVLVTLSEAENGRLRMCDLADHFLQQWDVLPQFCLAQPNSMHAPTAPATVP